MGNIKSYKGFNKDLVCRDYQYEVGQEYSLPKGQSPSVCDIGFHACESPLEVLDYYFLDDNANMSRFCEVEQSGELSRSNDRGSTKVASSKIKIKAEIKFADLIKLGVEWLKEKTSPSNVQSDGSLNDNGEREAQIGSSGYSAKIGSSGDSAQIGSSGYSAKITLLKSVQVATMLKSVQVATLLKSVQVATMLKSVQVATLLKSVQVATLLKSTAPARTA